MSSNSVMPSADAEHRPHSAGTNLKQKACDGVRWRRLVRSVHPQGVRQRASIRPTVLVSVTGGSASCRSHGTEAAMGSTARTGVVTTPSKGTRQAPGRRSTRDE
jgi:hypothetical protein